MVISDHLDLRAKHYFIADMDFSVLVCQHDYMRTDVDILSDENVLFSANIPRRAEREIGFTVAEPLHKRTPLREGHCLLHIPEHGR